jgi:ferredoxin-NADP reductase
LSVLSDEPVLSDQVPRELLVRQVTWAADGVVVLDLVDPDGGRLAPWAPGAHIDVVLPSGLIRQYSLCGDLDDDRTYRIGVLREPKSRGGSAEIHDTALVGRRVAVRGPRNHFALVDAPRYLLLAGGIGVTPMIPMLQQAERRGTPWHLVYGGRSRRTMAFLDEISQRAGGEIEIVTEEEQGYPDFDAILGEAAEGTAVYCCGPPGMIDVIEKKCAQYVTSAALHTERFNVAPASKDAREALLQENASIEVELARTGVTIVVPPDRTVLQEVLNVVPFFLFSCEEGYCGTCEAKVLEGEPDHRDDVLSPEEQAAGKMMICVSRAKTPRLVLDI